MNSSLASMGALRRARPTAAERAGRVPRGALHAAAQGSRARRSTARELGILAGEGACSPTKSLAQGVEAGQTCRISGRKTQRAASPARLLRDSSSLLTTQIETPDFPHTIVADMDLADSKGDFRWEHLEKQLPPGVTLQRGLRGFTDHPNFLVARAKKVRGS